LESNLKEKHVLITGASGGIGIETTKLFLREGVKVTAQYFTQNESLKKGIKDYQNYSLVSADLRKEDDIQNLIKKANQKFGRIDILIANAGIWPTKETRIHEMSLKQWENTIQTNLTGVFTCVKYFCQNLQAYPQPEAAIVLIGSTAGVFGEAGHVDYASSKAALLGLMLTVKNEITSFASKGRINLIHPGWTKTPMAENALKEDKDLVRKILQTIPLQKVATPVDIANMILFLSSDTLAGHITGQSITIAGGMEGRVLYDLNSIKL
jgi:NAD(P)-dependent dehydrogenase (short-subunit alcohol dehydrogenase family)